MAWRVAADRKLTHLVRYRTAPFEQGEKEKGFRDALIAEAFIQLVEGSPVAPGICRIVLVTNDGSLTQAINARTTNTSNVSVLPSVEKLKGLINTLVSQVSEHRIGELRAKAEQFFFQEGSENKGLVFRDKVIERIAERLSEPSITVPEAATAHKPGAWLIGSSDFVRKEGRRFFWTTRIGVELSAYRHEAPKYQQLQQPLPLNAAFTAPGGSNLQPSGFSVTTTPAFIGSSTNMAAVSLADIGKFTSSPEALYAAPFGIAVRREVATGTASFDVEWSVSVDARGRLSRGKTQDIKFIEVTWTPLIAFR
jgi:hypothetical protein